MIGFVLAAWLCSPRQALLVHCAVSRSRVGGDSPPSWNRRQLDMVGVQIAECQSVIDGLRSLSASLLKLASVSANYLSHYKWNPARSYPLQIGSILRIGTQEILFDDALDKKPQNPQPKMSTFRGV